MSLPVILSEVCGIYVTTAKKKPTSHIKLTQVNHKYLCLHLVKERKKTKLVSVSVGGDAE